MCFVTGTSSNPPYFDLSIQMIESLKATRWYYNVPIKVFDCGLTIEDANYLRSRFGCEVKDPGWDIEERHINKNLWGHNPNAFKGILARCFLQRHFPEYRYYFWIDADIWIQDENALDRLMHLCEKQGIAGTQEYQHNSYWCLRCPNRNFFTPTLPQKFLDVMNGRLAIITDAFCFNKEMAILYEAAVLDLIKEKKFSSGTDLSTLNYIFYRYIPNGIIIQDAEVNYTQKMRRACLLDTRKNLLHPDSSKYLGIIGLEEGKHLSCRVGIIPNQPVVHLGDESLKGQEEYYASFQNKQGSYFYRIYPDPEDLYGEMAGVL